MFYFYIELNTNETKIINLYWNLLDISFLKDGLSLKI